MPWLLIATATLTQIGGCLADGERGKHLAAGQLGLWELLLLLLLLVGPEAAPHSAVTMTTKHLAISSLAGQARRAETTHLHTPAHTCAHLHTPTHTCAHLHTPAHTCTHLRTPVHTCAHLHTPAHSFIYQRSYVFTCFSIIYVFCY